MKVGFLTSDLHHGHGWGHYGLSLIRALQRQGVDPIVVAASNSPTEYDFELHPILPTISPAETHQLAKLGVAAVQAHQLLRGCDVIHCTLEPYAPLALWVGNQQLPFVITGHGSYAQAGIDRHMAVRMLHQSAFRQAYRVICVSHYTEIRAQAYTPGIETTVINNGVDIERFAPLPPLDETVTRPTVLMTGGIKRRKGVLELVQAIASVREQVPDVQLVIVGSGTMEPDYTDKVKATVQSLSLGNHVRLLGFVPDETLLGWYGAADVFALPSMNSGWKFEGYGLVHLEASAAGLPVIGTRDCGAEDAIDDGVTGLLVSQENVAEELPAALIKLLTDNDLAARMGAAGREKARQQTWDYVGQQVSTLYEQASKN